MVTIVSKALVPDEVLGHGGKVAVDDPIAPDVAGLEMGGFDGEGASPCHTPVEKPDHV